MVEATSSQIVVAGGRAREGREDRLTLLRPRLEVLQVALRIPPLLASVPHTLHLASSSSAAREFLLSLNKTSLTAGYRSQSVVGLTRGCRVRETKKRGHDGLSGAKNVSPKRTSLGFY